MTPSADRRVIPRAYNSPIVHIGIVPPPSVQPEHIVIKAAPNNYFFAGPYRRVIGSDRRRVARRRRGPSIGSGIISSAGVEYIAVAILSAPHDHFSPSPCRGIKVPCSRRVSGRSAFPTISDRVVPAPGIHKSGRIPKTSTPDDHLIPRPDCCMKLSTGGRIGCARTCPSVCVSIIPPAGVENVAKEILSAPDDHFTSRPHRAVQISWIRRVNRARGRPTIRAGIVSAARDRKS